ncbi:AAA family ATPase [Promicromonospora sp. NPDC090134]|uniref:AAA family ATPase n=1 Tax=Promicromonospora sp. NPDC090134 TaxID=3364408 RepID=UPI003813CDA7
MQVKCLEIANFRKLESVRIDLSDQTTLLVGANNSGKTSAMDAVKQFLGKDSFKLSDFTLFHLSRIREIGERWEAAATPTTPGKTPPPQPGDEFQTIAEWSSFLPQLDIWIEAAEHELYRAPELLPLLDEYCGGVGVRLRLEPNNIPHLVKNYLKAREAVELTRSAEAEESKRPRLRPMNLVEFLEANIGTYFGVSAYRLDPHQVAGKINFAGNSVGGPLVPLPEPSAAQPQRLSEDSEPIARSVLNKLIHVDVIDAQRGLQNDESAVTLSSSIASYYKEHLDFAKHPTPHDLEAIRATQDASKIFDERLQEVFRPPLAEVARMGYPGTANPEPLIKTNMRLTDGLVHESVLRYRVGTPSDDQDAALFELSEGLNGLGYQNLVLMIFRLMSFRDRRLRLGKSGIAANDSAVLVPIHLVLVEEPEAHLHAQVQQVFINQAYSTLTTRPAEDRYADLTNQLVVSTHSSHIAHELEFDRIRYFCRGMPVEDKPVPTTVVKSLARVFGSDDETARFVKRYLKVNHCNLFFADAAILLEGAAERILLPSFVTNAHPKIAQCFVEYLEIGGAHAHRLKGLLVELAIPTLVITDIDATDEDGKKARPQRGSGQTTGSDALKNWLEASASVDDLLSLAGERKVSRGPTRVGVRFAYQIAVDAHLKGTEPVEMLPSTFEDAVVIENLELFASTTGTGLFGKFSATAKAAAEAGDLSTVAKALYESIQKGDKAKFALEMLLSIEDEKAVVVPGYIAEGLRWLESEVSKLPLLPSADVSGTGAAATGQA